MINGVPYILAPAPSLVAGAQANLCDHNKNKAVNDLIDFHAFMALDDLVALTNMDWDDFDWSVPDPLGDNTGLTATKVQTHMPFKDSPFVLDMGATCHISPDQSDFDTLSAIPPHPVRGLGGTCVYAVGLGNIKLHLRNGHNLILHNVLYIPTSKVRLVSVLALNHDGDYMSHFGATSCWITTTNGNCIAEGCVSTTRGLYTLAIATGDTFTAMTTSPSPVNDEANDRATIDTTLYTTPVPDVETWHQWLGHCSSHMVVNMARNNVIKGMPIDLSSMPPKCDHCILGKQACSLVPKAWEGTKAAK